MNLVRVSQATGLPLRPKTFYAWHHKKKYPEIFVKFGGALFVDVDRLDQAMEKARVKAER